MCPEEEREEQKREGRGKGGAEEGRKGERGRGC